MTRTPNLGQRVAQILALRASHLNAIQRIDLELAKLRTMTSKPRRTPATASRRVSRWIEMLRNEETWSVACKIDSDISAKQPCTGCLAQPLGGFSEAAQPLPTSRACCQQCAPYHRSSNGHWSPASLGFASHERSPGRTHRRSSHSCLSHASGGNATLSVEVHWVFAAVRALFPCRLGTYRARHQYCLTCPRSVPTPPRASPVRLTVVEFFHSDRWPLLFLSPPLTG